MDLSIRRHGRLELEGPLEFRSVSMAIDGLLSYDQGPFLSSEELPDSRNILVWVVFCSLLVCNDCTDIDNVGDLGDFSDKRSLPLLPPETICDKARVWCFPTELRPQQSISAAPI